MFNSISSNTFKLSPSNLNSENLNTDRPDSSTHSSWIDRAYNDFIHYLLRGHELYVREKRNAAGDVYYHGYDPYSGRSAYLTSDHELRAWLEQLPYQ